MNNAKKYLYDLVSFPSITPNDAGSIDYIKNLLEANCFSVVVKTFGDAEKDGYQVKNLYAKYGNSNNKNICFAGHVDVVPPGNLESWHFDPFKAHEIEDKIYARGAVDMKGALAAFLAASLDYIKAQPDFKGAISFLITSDEEGEAKFGTAKMLEYLHSINEKIDLVILGEPTSKDQIADQIKIGRRGSMNCVLKVIGKQGHVAYPKDAINPIPILINIMHDLANITLDSGSEFFEPSNLEITSLEVANPVNNIIPEIATAKFNIRFNHLQTRESLLKTINQTIQKHTLNYNFTNNLSAEIFIQKTSGIINDFLLAVQQSSGINTIFTTTGGTSDARFIHKYYPVVELGAKHESAHKINEFIENNDLQKLYKVYYDCLYYFLGF